MIPRFIATPLNGPRAEESADRRDDQPPPGGISISAMRKLLAAFLLLVTLPALAQFTPGQVLTAAQLNNQFSLYVPLAGGTLTGPLTVPTLSVTGSVTTPTVTAAPTSGAALTVNPAGTNSSFIDFTNGGTPGLGYAYVGFDVPGGTLASGTTPQAFIVGSGGNHPVQIVSNNIVVGTFSSSGLSLPTSLSISSGGTGATTATDATANLQYLQGAPGSIARSLAGKLGERISVKDFGALGDGINRFDGAITSGSAVLTSASGTFSSSDIGKPIIVSGAASAGLPLVTTIASVSSATSATLSANASTTVSGASYVYGTDDTSAINAAVASIRLTGGIIYFPRGTYMQTSTITENNQYVMFLGDGGAIDGNQTFTNTWANIVSSAATRVVWAGAANGTMLNIQPVDDGAHAPLNGNGVTGMMWDCAERAQIGWLFKTLRNGKFSDSSVVRCTNINISLGTTTNNVYGGNVSLSGNVFDNVAASNANLTATTNSAIPWVMWGNALIGGVNENEFRNLQAFSATYTVGTPSWDIGNTDDNSWYESKWNGSMILQAADTGTHDVTSFSLSQNHFFYKTLGNIIVKEANNPGTQQPSFGHVVYGYSGNLINPITVQGRGDITVYGTTINYSNRLGLMTYGSQPAFTNVYLSAEQSIPNNTTTAVTWAGANYDQLSAWSSGSPTQVTVPANVKWANGVMYCSWGNNGTGQRYIGIYLAGSPVAEQQNPASGSSQQTITTGVIPVSPGQVFTANVLQVSGGALNINNTCRMTINWY
ncbi:glycosyl hydrolase family 28-related protein [Burkholderia pseudomallei]|uniref:glycosyl hydrolase family 28-related protein n=1 Tax=Burkholderia pseudomallei TaxID=28450 RepID=UPI00100B1A4E|nr:hypothetical protein [Burkholderia pseudomallei]